MAATAIKYVGAIEVKAVTPAVRSKNDANSIITG